MSQKILIVGADGFIGSALMRHLTQRFIDVVGTTRRASASGFHLDMLDIPRAMPDATVVYICAAMTRFIECEDDGRAYRINVDAPAAIAKRYDPKYTRIIYLSSEAVERALHTNYGMHKAFAELSLRNYANAVIARLSKVTPENLPAVCHYLAGLIDVAPGMVYPMPRSQPASLRSVG